MLTRSDLLSLASLGVNRPSAGVSIAPDSDYASNVRFYSGCSSSSLSASIDGLREAEYATGAEAASGSEVKSQGRLRVIPSGESLINLGYVLRLWGRLSMSL